MTAPISHLEEGNKLTSDALVSLFELQLKRTPSPITQYFKNGPTVTWDGNTYEGIPCKMSSVAIGTDGKLPRPTLTIFNPYGAFNEAAHKGYFDGALLIRHRVLKQHIDDGIVLDDPQYWYCPRPKEVIANQHVILELRMLSDGPMHQLPARLFTPPDFPFVTF